MKHRKVMYLTNFIFNCTFFHIAFYHHKQIAEFDNNWFIFKNWKRQSCRDSFPWKNGPWFIRIAPFLKIWWKAIWKKNHLNIKLLNTLFFYFLNVFIKNNIFSNPLNNNIAILESKIMYFCLRPNFSWPNYLILIKWILICWKYIKIKST